MLFTTDGQLLIAGIFLFSSLLLCLLAVFVYFVINRYVKYDKLKYTILLFADLIIILLFAFCFIFICTKFNYGLIRWYVLFAYILPIVLFLYFSKRRKIAKLANLESSLDDWE